MSPYKQYSNKDKKDTVCDELVSILKEVKKDAARETRERESVHYELTEESNSR
jgi:hypothetical protein